MTIKETEGNEQTLIALPTPVRNIAIDIPNAPTVKLQTLDLARHVAIAPDGKRYVVATIDESHVGRDYITSVYPQQSNYLTMVRMTVCELFSKTPQEAVQRHIATIQAIQNGKIKELVAAAQ